MNKTGWKVVKRADNGDFKSSRIMKGWRWCVSYGVGKRSTGRHGTPVLAFRTRANARRFKDFGDLVFKATLENPEPIDSLEYYIFTQNFAVFWKQVKARQGPADAPDGTLACDAITLLERA